MKYLLLLSLLLANLFACGCVDSPNASAGATMINEFYDGTDSALAELFDKQVEILNEIMQKELLVHEKYTNNLSFNVDSILELNNFNFELEKTIQIRNVND